MRGLGGSPRIYAGGAGLQPARKIAVRIMSGFSRRQFDFDIHSGLMSAPPETRTFFTSSATWERRAILQSHNLCDLLLEVIRENRAKHRLQVHEFVFMRDHIHLILTPAPLVSLEKAVPFIKGSSRADFPIAPSGN